jgi:hypothetical protein
MTNHPNRRKSPMVDYFDRLPVKVPKGRVAVHNHVIVAKQLGVRGFRAWHAKPNAAKFEPCPCHWAPHLDVHYRVKATHDWTEEQRAASDTHNAWLHEICSLAAQFAADQAYDGAMEKLLEQEEENDGLDLHEIFLSALEGYDATQEDIDNAYEDFEAMAIIRDLVERKPGMTTSTQE